MSPQDTFPQTTRVSANNRGNTQPSRSSSRKSKPVYYGEDSEGEVEEEDEVSSFSGGDVAWRAGYIHTLQTRRNNNNSSNNKRGGAAANSTKNDNRNNNSSRPNTEISATSSHSTAILKSTANSKTRITPVLISASSNSISSSPGNISGRMTHLGYESKVGRVGARLSHNGTVKVVVDKGSDNEDISSVDLIDDSEFDNDYEIDEDDDS